MLVNDYPSIRGLGAPQRTTFTEETEPSGARLAANEIRLLPRVSPSAAKERAVAALRYTRPHPVHRIDVDVDGETVNLSGAVGSYRDRQRAERAVLAMPHVRAVNNNLRILRT